MDQLPPLARGRPHERDYRGAKGGAVRQNACPAGLGPESHEQRFRGSRLSTPRTTGHDKTTAGPRVKSLRARLDGQIHEQLHPCFRPNCHNNHDGIVEDECSSSWFKPFSCAHQRHNPRTSSISEASGGPAERPERHLTTLAPTISSSVSTVAPGDGRSGT